MLSIRDTRNEWEWHNKGGQSETPPPDPDKNRGHLAIGVAPLEKCLSPSGNGLGRTPLVSQV